MYDSVFHMIGRYQVEKEIGRGQMGIVYLAYDGLIDRKVAIKAINTRNIFSDQQRQISVDLFFKEANIIGKLSHSHVAQIYDMGIQEGQPYQVMEFVDGKTIKQMVDQEKPLERETILVILSMIARGLFYVHQRGILHRDIKPGNIMIQRDNIPKIMDFGIARIRDQANRSKKTKRDYGLIAGTPHYMSPEQVLGKEMDARGDIFSLGILAYEWLSGHKPFNGKGIGAIACAIVEQEPIHLKNLAAVDSRLAAIIHRALHKDPEHRYQNAEAFSNAIEIYLSEKQRSHDIGDNPLLTSLSKDQLATIAKLKKTYRFFRDFSDTEFSDIIECANRERYEQGTPIISEGSTGVKMYVILRGEVSVRKHKNGHSIEIKRLAEGDCFGEMAIINNLPRSATVIALRDTCVVAINGAVLEQDRPELCLKLYRNLAAVMSDRLRALDERFLDIAPTNGDE